MERSQEAAPWVELTSSQDQIWLSQRAIGPSTAYNLTFAYCFLGPLDVAVFERAYQQLVREADCLRSSFIEINGRAYQSIHFDHAPPLDRLDFSSAADPDGAYQAWASAQARRPIDLSQPLLGCWLAKVSDERAYWVITIHHCLADSWGLYVLYRRLKSLYEALLAGEAIPQPGLPPVMLLKKFDEQYHRSKQFQEDQFYWNQKLHLSSGPVPIFGKVCREELCRTRRVVFDLDAALVQKIAAQLSRPEFAGRTPNVALFNLLFTAYAVFLYRVSGSNTFMVGVPYLNRPGELRNVPGLTIEQVPLYVEIQPEDTFYSLFERLREESKETARHSHYSVPNKMNQVYNTVFNFHNRPFEQDSAVETWYYSASDVNPLVLNIFNPNLQAGSIQMGFDYSTDLFSERDEQRLREYFLRALEAFMDNPQASVDFPGLLGPEELHRLLVEFNPPPHRSSDRFFIHQFEDQVRRAPQAVAVEAPNGQLTYRQLDQRSSALARYLRGLGVRPGVSVGLYIDRSTELAAGLMAIFKAGGTYIPLDPTYPEKRLEHILADAEISLVLTREAVAGRFPDAAAHKILIDKLALDEQDGSPLPVEYDLDAPAYITYTSGSTGTPKGVVVTHRKMIHYLDVVTEYIALGPGDRFLYFAALGFDASIEEIFPTLKAGATMVIRPDGLLTLDAFNRILNEGQITVLSLPAAFWGEWVNGLVENHLPLPAALRLLTVYAEEPNMQRFNAWMNLPGAERVRWINTYGPTEAVVDATFFEPDVAAHKDTRWARLPIGRPIANHTVYILDAKRQPVPLGTPGEIYIGGDISDGYRNLEKETRERFLPDPFSQQPGAMMYKSGDMGRFLDDGQIEFIGRVDFQVKLRGFRIELGEIENTILTYPGVGQAVVLLRKDRHDTDRLVAYITLGHDAPFEISHLADYLKKLLPDYMIPSAVMVLPEFPVTPHGKINREALPQPEIAARGSAGQQAQSTLERELIVIWEKILNTSPIGVDEDFFELGGNSLLGVRMFDLINHQMNIQLPVSELFQSPTVRKLAKYIEENAENYTPSCAVLLRQGRPDLPVFLIHGWGGGVVGYADLVRELDPRWTVYGIQAAGLAQEQDFDETMQAMVERYIRAVRQIQPSGPYRLGGYCTGGVISYAMACELVKQGDAVAFVGLIEADAQKAPLETPPLLSPRRLSVIWRSLPFWFSEYRALGWGGIRQRLHNVFRNLSRSLTRLRRGSVELQAKDIILDDPAPLPDLYNRILLSQWQLMERYQPEPYAGDVVVYHAAYPTISQALTGPLDLKHGWQHLVKGSVKVRVVESAHRNIHLPPYSASLAGYMQEDLDP
jgi:amino acid adenylation domain-containing protein